MMDKNEHGTRIASLPHDTFFHVHNGQWDGRIVEENGVKTLYVFDTPDGTTQHVLDPLDERRLDISIL